MIKQRSHDGVDGTMSGKAETEVFEVLGGDVETDFFKLNLSWRLYDGAPKFLGNKRLLELTANTVHYLLYAFMFIQPLSGWAMSSAAGYKPTLFGLFTFPG